MTTAEGVRIRPAELSDDAALGELDRRCWSPRHEVTEGPPEPGRPFFTPPDGAAGHLVAEDAGRLVGYVRVTLPTPLPSNAHVRQVQGLAVSPDARGRGIGRALVVAAVARARADGARRIWLRVLGSNPEAQRTYAAAGFAVEGVLPGEFLRAGRYVDDILMGRPLA